MDLRLRIVALLAAASIAGVAGAGAVPPQSGVIDLRTDAKLRIDGAATADFAGSSVSIAGDVNGDGKLDVVIGTRGTNNNGRVNSGGAYVLFGEASGSLVDLSQPGASGFRIDGAVAEDQAGTSVSAAGDVNRDGLGDVIIGAEGADNNGRANSGSAYVVFGKASTEPVDLAALGSAGFRIDGADANDNVGDAVSGAGDVNNDDFADVIVGARLAGMQAGSAYVLFGSSSPTNVDLAAFPASGGFRIDGLPSSTAGDSVSAAGDMNGDGFDDVLVGASNATAAYVVFGKSTTAIVDLGMLGTGGFRIAGAATFDGTGLTVSAAGDVNGDGRPDVVIGSLDVSNHGRNLSGSVSVVFGKTPATDVDLGALGTDGFRIDGASPVDRTGWSVSGAGDVNGDGLADVLVGAPFTDNNGRTDAGSAYVVFGRASTAPVDLAQLGTNGYRFDGSVADAQAGDAVTGGRDVSGDGLPDVVIAASRESRDLRPLSGSVYVFGFGQPRLAYAPITGIAGTAILTHAPTQLERTGPATFQVAPPLPAGLSIDAGGRVSGTPSAVHSHTHTVTMEDLVGTVSAPLTITVAAPPPPPPEPDLTAPQLILRATSPQRALRQKKIIVRASCNEACRLTAQGSITILGRRRARIPLRSASASRASTAQRTLGLALTAASRKRLAGFLAKGRRARANVTVRARDVAGNQRSASRAIVVRR